MWNIVPNPNHDVIIDDRVFLIGLDCLYRDQMKWFEADKLLPCAEKMAQVLAVQPADIPIEGYYTESHKLRQYFQTMRALQEVNVDKQTAVNGLFEFEFIMKILTSGLYGEPVHNDKLLPGGRDPLSRALKQRAGMTWNIPTLMKTAYEYAADHDDFSLVSLAVRTRDPVVVTALRESVVLYAEMGYFGIKEEPQFRYIWRVSPEIAETASRFIQTFNQLTSGELPLANARNAEIFLKAFTENQILGRCVRLGDSGGGQPPYYHWAIYTTNWHNPQALQVEDFWNEKIVTTETYRAHDPGKGPVNFRLT